MSGNAKRRYLPALLWAALIMVVSSIPDLSTKSIRIGYIDKIAHFGEYSVLGFLTAYAIGGFHRSAWRIFGISSLLSALYGIFDELHQLFVPGRTTEIWDMAADILGAVLASALYVRFGRREGTSDSRDRSAGE